MVPVTQEIVIVDVSAADLAGSKKKSMKRLTCRKCEGHGLYAILKGHAGVCPFKDCTCGTCASVMSMRANALIRRFRHRQPDQSMAVVKALRSKNGNMRLRIVAKDNQETYVESDGTLVTYSNDKNGHQTYTTRRSSVMTVQSDGRDSVVSTPPSTTNNSTPSGSPPLLLPYGDMDTPTESLASCDSFANMLKANLIQQLLLNPTPITPTILSLLLQPACPPSEMIFEHPPLAPPTICPSFLPTGIPVQPL